MSSSWMILFMASHSSFLRWGVRCDARQYGRTGPTYRIVVGSFQVLTWAGRSCFGSGLGKRIPIGAAFRARERYGYGRGPFIIGREIANVYSGDSFTGFVENGGGLQGVAGRAHGSCNGGRAGAIRVARAGTTSPAPLRRLRCSSRPAIG